MAGKMKAGRVSLAKLERSVRAFWKAKNAEEGRQHHLSLRDQLIQDGEARRALEDEAKLDLYPIRPGTLGTPAPSGNTGRDGTYVFTSEGRPAGVYGSVDWCDFTLVNTHDETPITSGYVIREILGMDPDQFQNLEHGFRRYRRVLMYGEIKVCFDGVKSGMGVHVNMSGQGCRHWEATKQGTECWTDLFRDVLTRDGHFTRLDLALDDTWGHLSLNRIRRHLRPANGYTVVDECGNHMTPTRVRSLFRDYTPYEKRRIRDGKERGNSVMFGSPKGSVLIRVYDKALEQKVDVHWVRAEAQLRDQRANLAAIRLLEKPVGQVAAEVMDRYIQFVDASRDTNHSRWPKSKWWKDFLGEVEKISLSRPRPTRTVEAHKDWMEHSLPSSFAIVFAALEDNASEFMRWCFLQADRGFMRLKGKHRAMLAEWSERNERTTRAMRSVGSAILVSA